MGMRLKLSSGTSAPLSFQADFENFDIRSIDEIGPFFTQFLENFENMTQVYSSFYTVV